MKSAKSESEIPHTHNDGAGCGWKNIVHMPSGHFCYRHGHKAEVPKPPVYFSENSKKILAKAKRTPKHVIIQHPGEKTTAAKGLSKIVKPLTGILKQSDKKLCDSQYKDVDSSLTKKTILKFKPHIPKRTLALKKKVLETDK